MIKESMITSNTLLSNYIVAELTKQLMPFACQCKFLAEEFTPGSFDQLTKNKVDIFRFFADITDILCRKQDKISHIIYQQFEQLLDQKCFEIIQNHNQLKLILTDVCSCDCKEDCFNHICIGYDYFKNDEFKKDNING